MEIANFQLVSIGSLRSGLLGNPIGGLHFCDYGLHPFHPWHKCLDWLSPKSNHPSFWVNLVLKIKRKKTLVRDKLFWICLAYLQSIWDFLGQYQSSQWNLNFGPPENTQSAQSTQSKHRVTQSEHRVILGSYLQLRVHTNGLVQGYNHSVFTLCSLCVRIYGL